MNISDAVRMDLLQPFNIWRVFLNRAEPFGVRGLDPAFSLPT